MYVKLFCDGEQVRLAKTVAMFPDTHLVAGQPFTFTKEEEDFYFQLLTKTINYGKTEKSPPLIERTGRTLQSQHAHLQEMDKSCLTGLQRSKAYTHLLDQDLSGNLHIPGHAINERSVAANNPVRCGIRRRVLQ